MPGKKSKPKKKTGSGAGASTQSAPRRSLDSLAQDIDDAYGWDTVALLICDAFALPDLSTRSGLKRVHSNFEDIFKRLDDAYSSHSENPKITGGIVAVWSKMCNDYLLREKLFKKNFLSRIYPLLNQPDTAQLAVRSLASMSRMGGMPFRLAIAREAPRLTKLLKDHPDDIKLAELVITTLAHCVCAITDELDPPAKDIRALQVPDMLRAILPPLRDARASGYMLSHGHELLMNMSFNCAKEIRAEPACVRYLVAFFRSDNMALRGGALRSITRLVARDAVPDRTQYDPQKMMSLMNKPWPPEVDRVLANYGPQNTDIAQRVQGMNSFTKAIMKYAQDRNRDVLTLAVTLSELILQTEFSVVEGMLQTENPRTGKTESRDMGLGFIRWTDALPLCANKLRENGNAREQDMADVLQCKFLVLRERLEEGIALAQRCIARSPDFAYFYYVVSLTADHTLGLRSAKRGAQCRATLTPFLKHALQHRAVEHAAALAAQALSEASPGHPRWRDGVGFLRSAADDCRAYIAGAPPDQRQMKTVLNRYIMLLPVVKGPAIDENMSQLAEYRERLRIAEACSVHLNLPVFDTDARLGAALLTAHWVPAAREWGDVVRRHDADDAPPDGDASAPAAVDAFDRWVADVQAPQVPQDVLEDVCEHPRLGGHEARLHRCANCGNPSAVLRKCSRCGRVRYCDGQFQTMHWGEHKSVCNPSG